MQKEAPQKLLFVINPISGGIEKAGWEAGLQQYFKNLPHHIELYVLTGKEEDKSSVKHYIEKLQPDKVVAVGGDGTIKLIAEIVKNTSAVIGIIPGGSANGMAKELNIPADGKEALDIILNGMVKPIDLIKINEEICLHLSDIGLNAMLVKYFEQSEKRGMWSYGKAVFRVLWSKQLIYATIKVNDQIIKRKAYMVVIANATKYGTGAIINPDGNVSDGFFEVVVIRKIKLWELFKMLLKHKGFNMDYIEVLQTKKLDLITMRKTYFQIDGEYRSKVKNVRADIMPQAIKVMVASQSGKENNR